MSEKCWLVVPKNDDGAASVYVVAETAEKARSEAMYIDESGYLADVGYRDLRATRARKFDGGFTIYDLLADGCWWICYGCDNRVYGDDGECDPIVDGQYLYCSPECRQNALGRVGDVPEPAPPAVMHSIGLSNDW